MEINVEQGTVYETRAINVGTQRKSNEHNTCLCYIY